ncbi:MAG: ABC transporter permease [bacterium]|nr:ABC transporter permease [bacterium]
MPIQSNNLRLIIRTAFFIASKSIQRGSLTVKFVTVFILLLTFLNLIVVGGLLVGITEDVGVKVKDSLTGDIFIEPAKEYNYIQNTGDIFSLLNGVPNVHYSPRLTSGVSIEYEYKNVTGGKNPSRVSAVIAGLEPILETRVTNIDQRVIAGSFLDENWDSIVLGSSLVDGYISSKTGSEASLGHVLIGDKVRIRFSNNNLYEFTVIGILNSKSSTVDQRAFINQKILRQLLSKQGNDYSEIAVVTGGDISSTSLIKELRGISRGDRNDIKSSDEAIPSAVGDLKKAFRLIGNIVSVTALLVGVITIFVIIYVNASSRRRYLGILKAQGISAPTLILSYVFQIIFYVAVGVILGLIALFVFLQPYFMKNPISLPMADGQLLLTSLYVSIRVVVLFISSIISAFIPAWLIIRQNTLDAILGR